MSTSGLHTCLILLMIKRHEHNFFLSYSMWDFQESLGLIMMPRYFVTVCICNHGSDTSMLLRLEANVICSCFNLRLGNWRSSIVLFCGTACWFTILSANVSPLSCAHMTVCPTSAIYSGKSFA